MSSISRSENESGAITGLFCEGHDVTDRHEMNEAIAALEMKMIHSSRVNAMGTMAAALAHELNQPLTAITNYLAGIRPVDGQTPDVERLIGAMEGIKESAERAAGIIKSPASADQTSQAEPAAPSTSGKLSMNACAW